MKWFKENSQSIVFLLPSLAVTVLLTGYGLLYAIVTSFQEEGIGTYASVIGHTMFQSSLLFSLKVTFLATIVSLLLGMLLAKLLYHTFRSSNLKLVIWLPMLIPHFVAAYLVLIIFSQSGLFSSVLYHIGLISDRLQFPILVFDQRGLGIILTYIWKSVPFVVLMVLPAFYEIDHRYKSVVRTLGGGSFEVFKMVEWPWLYPVILEVGLILFAFIIGAFEVPYLLGVTDPKMISVLAYQWFFTGDWSYRTLSMALMLLLTAFVLLLAFILFRFMQKNRSVIMKGR